MTNMKKRCLIIEDNQAATEVILNFISRVPSLEVASTFSDPTEAIAFLHASPKIDLMFVDIKLPHITGLDLLKSLDTLPSVIITTAHSQYATDGFDIGVTDFLCKPYSFERFLKAVNRAIGVGINTVAIHKQPFASPSDHIFLKIGRQLQKFNLDDIIYIEAYTVLSKLYTPEKMYVISEAISDLETKLPEYYFIRIHKSFMVARSQIKSYDSKAVFLKFGIKIPLGATYRDKFLKSYNEFG